MSEPESNRKTQWRVFAGVPDENAAHLMCSFLKAAGLHPVIERSDAIAHYGFMPASGCRVLLPDDEHGIALEAYAKVAVMPPGAAERAFETEEREDVAVREEPDNAVPANEEPAEWMESEADAESWKQASDESSAAFAPEPEVVPYTGPEDEQDDLDLPREQWTERERNAADAFDLSRVGIFGWIALPQILYLLIRVARSDDRLRASFRSKAVRAAWLSVPLFALYFVVVPGALFISYVVTRR